MRMMLRKETAEIGLKTPGIVSAEIEEDMWLLFPIYRSEIREVQYNNNLTFVKSENEPMTPQFPKLWHTLA